MGMFLVLMGFLGILVGLINVVYPIRKLKITSRKMAAAVLGASCITFVVGGIMLPPSKTPDQAAIKAAAANVAASTESTLAGAVAAAATATPAPIPAAAPALTPAETPTPAPGAETVPLVSVTDGDTIKVSIGGKTESVRLIGMDTPETVHPSQPVGAAFVSHAWPLDLGPGSGRFSLDAV